MHNKFQKPFTVIQLFLLGWSSLGCGKGFDSAINRLEETSQAEFYASLTPLNTTFGSFKGWARISISDNQFWARVKVFGPKTNDMHRQYIHLGSRCPRMQDDANQDGYLDFIEVQRITGSILIPLDANLTTQQKGIFDFPKMRRHSFYYYSEASNFQWLLEDLKKEDVILDDFMSKLGSQESLNIGQRVVVIYGIDQEKYLPSTVETIPGYPAQFTFPIACGKIRFGVHDDMNDFGIL